MPAQRTSKVTAGAKTIRLELAGGLSNYSEQDQKYVNTLQGIIRTNELFLTDKARLPDGPAVLLVEADGPAHQVVIEEEIGALRASGELARIIHSMQLDEAD